MAKDFEVAKTKVPDNLSDAEVAAAIETFLDDLDIGTDHTVYEITIDHVQGFWNVIIVYEP